MDIPMEATESKQAESPMEGARSDVYGTPDWRLLRHLIFLGDDSANDKGSNRQPGIKIGGTSR